MYAAAPALVSPVLVRRSSTTAWIVTALTLVTLLLGTVLLYYGLTRPPRRCHSGPGYMSCDGASDYFIAGIVLLSLGALLSCVTAAAWAGVGCFARGQPTPLAAQIYYANQSLYQPPQQQFYTQQATGYQQHVQAAVPHGVIGSVPPTFDAL